MAFSKNLLGNSEVLSMDRKLPPWVECKVVECLLGMCWALRSITSTAKKKKNSVNFPYE